MNRNKEITIESLKRLINHPNTSLEESQAAKAALRRLIGTQRNDIRLIFSKAIKEKR